MTLEEEIEVLKTQLAEKELALETEKVAIELAEEEEIAKVNAALDELNAKIAQMEADKKTILEAIEPKLAAIAALNEEVALLETEIAPQKDALVKIESEITELCNKTEEVV